jgi:hypothetical protein
MTPLPRISQEIFQLPDFTVHLSLLVRYEPVMEVAAVSVFPTTSQPRTSSSPLDPPAAPSADASLAAAAAADVKKMKLF